MVVRVRLGSSLSSVAGRAQLQIEVPDGATVATLVERVDGEVPALRARLTNALAVVDGSHLTRNQRLPRGKEVALLSPASGG